MTAIKPLGELVSIRKGEKHELASYGYPYIQIDDLRPNAHAKFTSDSIGTEVAQNDLIIAWDGANAGTIGHGLSGLIGSTLARLRPISKDGHTPYLYYLLQGKFRDIRANCTGATIPHVSKDYLTKIPVPLPPLEEQKRIAAILDKADAIRKKRKQAIELTEQFLRSAFFDMFGDPITNPKDWPIATIGELFSEGQLLVHKDGNYGGMYPQAHEFGGTGIPFLTAKCVDGDGIVIHSKVTFLNEDKANTFNYGWIETGDVLLAHNATVGRVALYHGGYPKALIGTSLTCFRPDQNAFDSRFLFAMLRSAYFQRQLEKAMSQSTRNQVPITAQREMRLFIPPPPLQQSFGCILDKAYRNHQQLLGSATQQELLFNSLVNRAFRGEL